MNHIELRLTEPNWAVRSSYVIRNHTFQITQFNIRRKNCALRTLRIYFCSWWVLGFREVTKIFSSASTMRLVCEYRWTDHSCLLFEKSFSNASSILAGGYGIVMSVTVVIIQVRADTHSQLVSGSQDIFIFTIKLFLLSNI